MRSALRFAALLLLATAALAAHAGPAAALGVYATTSGGGGGPSTLYRLNYYNGTPTLVGPIGFNRVGAMDAHPVTGVLYACAEDPGTATPVLIRIDTQTGAGTLIGPTGAPGSISDIAFRPSDGKLFAHDADPGQHRLYTIDITNGAATLLGLTTVPGSGNGLEFSVDNLLYLTTESAVYRLDQSTGAATYVGAMSYNPALPGLPRPAAMDVYISGTDFVALVNTGAGNVQFGLIGAGTGSYNNLGDTGLTGLDGIAVVSRPTAFATDGSGGNPGNLYRLDLASGAPTFIGPIGFDHVGAIEVSPAGILYATATRPGSGTPVLITIDPVTGKGTEIGPTGVSAEISDLTFRGSQLYGYNALNDPDHSLYTFNMTTGAATLVGHTGNTFQGGNGIAVSPSGITIWHASSINLTTLNHLTGVATFQGPVSFAPPMNTGGGRPPAMDYHWNGTLFSLVREQSVPRMDLATFDFFTHEFRQVADIGLAELDGFAVRTNQNPQALVLSPNGGEAFLGNSNQIITWDTFQDPTVQKVNIAVSTTVDLVASTGGSSGGDDNLFGVDLGTAAVALHGPIGGFNRVGAMAMDPVTGTLFACAQRTGDATPVLIAILPSTGIAWEVGPTGIPSGAISDLAFRPSDNTLFAYDASNSPTHSLYTINTQTGKGTLVGSTGLAGSGGNGIAFSPGGVLYHANRTDLNTLDPATGLATPVAPMSYPLPLSSTARAAALEFHPGDGTLYAIIKDGAAAYLATVDPATAAVTVIGDTGEGDLDGMAFVFGPFANVALGEPNDGAYAWSVPNTPTNLARVLITVFDDADGSELDFSNGFFRIIGPVSVPDATTPQGAYLAAVTPNPFRGAAPIRFGLPRAASVRLTVHDVRGALARSLVDGWQPAGERVVRWDGRDGGGRALPAGVYLLRLEVEGQVTTRRATLLH